MSRMSRNTHNNRFQLKETRRVMAAKLTNLIWETAAIRILVVGDFSTFPSVLLLPLWQFLDTSS